MEKRWYYWRLLLKKWSKNERETEREEVSQRRFNSSQKKLLLFPSKKLFEIINFFCYGKWNSQNKGLRRSISQKRNLCSYIRRVKKYKSVLKYFSILQKLLRHEEMFDSTLFNSNNWTKSFRQSWKVINFGSTKNDNFRPLSNISFVFWF
jgi:hypothetical protein